MTNRFLSLARQSFAGLVAFAIVVTSSFTPGAKAYAAPALPGLSALPTPPESLGFLAERHQGTNARHVILIQDLHAHLDTQKKIIGLLNFYDKNGFVQHPLGLEGASGTWDLSLWRDVPLKERKQAFYDYLLQEAGLTGPEWFALNTQRPTLLTGIDSKDDAYAQRALFVQSRAAREIAAQQIANVQDALQGMSANAPQSRAFGKWQRLTADFDAGKLQADVYLRHLNDLAAKVQLTAQAQTLRTALNATTSAQMAELSTSDRFYSDIRRFGQQVGIALAAPAQQNVVKALYAADFLKRLFRQQMTLEDIQQIGSHPQTSATLAHQLIAATGETSFFDEKGLLELVRLCTDFYVAALVRDEPMAQNTLALFNAQAPAAVQVANTPDTVILVSGGFHTQGLTEAFRKAGVSYDVITPNITAPFTPADEARYADRMAGVPVSLQGFLHPGSASPTNSASELRTPQSKTLNAVIEGKVNPKDPDVISMFGTESSWLGALKAYIDKRDSIFGRVANYSYSVIAQTAGLQPVAHPAFQRAWESLGPVENLPPAYSRLRSVRVYTGSPSPELLATAKIDAVGDNRTFARETEKDGSYTGLLQESGLRGAEDFLPGGRFYTPESAKLIAAVFAFHESVEGHTDLEVRPDGGIVTHEDLVAYGATLDQILEGLETGWSAHDNKFIERVHKDLGIDFFKAAVPGVGQWKKYRDQPNLFTAEMRQAGDDLIAIGQAHLFADWESLSVMDEQKRTTLNDALRVSHTYRGGLVGLGRDLDKLRRDRDAGSTRFDGLVPVPPQVTRTNMANDAANADSEYRHLEDIGLKHFSGAILAMPAGGLGQRLESTGHKFKLGIELSSIADKRYFDHYVETAEALAQESKSGGTVPVLIVTSDDNDDYTQALIKERGFALQDTVTAPGDRKLFVWKRGNQIVLTTRQNQVPSVNENWFFVKNADGSLRTQPPGHGDIHTVIRQFNLNREWKAEGRSHIIFIQDTNAMASNAILPALGLAVEKNAGMVFVGIPRTGGDKTGLVSDLVPEAAFHQALQTFKIDFVPQRDGSLTDVLANHGINADDFYAKVREFAGTVQTSNVEYAIANAALKKTVAKDGDVSDSRTGLSPFPGNTNILVLSLDAYSEALDATEGVMPQIINMKAGKLARPETNMQDISDEIGKLGYPIVALSDANLYGAVFSTTKNDLESGAKAARPETQSSSESDLYQTNRNLLAKAGVAVNVAGTPIMVAGVRLSDGARVWLGKRFFSTVGKLLDRVSGGSISNTSTLVVDGEGIRLHNLYLDGALELITGPGVQLDVNGALVINNAQHVLTPTPAGTTPTNPDAVARGYDMVQVNSTSVKRIHIYTPGEYRLYGNHRLEKKVGDAWQTIPDLVEVAPVPTSSSLFSRRWIAALVGIAGFAMGVAFVFLVLPIHPVLGVLGAGYGLTQSEKLFAFGDAAYLGGSRGTVTGATRSYQRAHEFVHSVFAILFGQANPNNRAREFIEEALAEALSPILSWLTWASAGIGRFVGWLRAHARRPGYAPNARRDARVEHLTNFLTNGHVDLADISGLTAITGDRTYAQRVSAAFSHIWGYLAVHGARQNDIAYQRALERIDASA